MNGNDDLMEKEEERERWREKKDEENMTCAGNRALHVNYT